MIPCPNCNKPNQDHYKFCLACGTKLPAAPPPSSAQADAPPPVAPSELSPATPSVDPTCPACGFANPDGFQFCGRCGTALIRIPPPVVASGEPLGDSPGVPMAHPPTDAFPIASPAPPHAESQDGSSPHLGLVPDPATGAGARLIMLGPDGQPVGERRLGPDESLEIGRTAGAPWDDDAYLDAHHARLQVTDVGIQVTDHNSLNGVFLKLQARVEIQHGDQFRVGQELLLYEDLPEPTPTLDGTERMGSPNPGYWGRLSVLVDPNRPSLAFPIEGDGISIGRETGQITFPQDGYVSGQHCRVIGDDTGIYIEDLGSSNGTYMRLRSGQVAPFGCLLLIGQKLFQIEHP